MLRAPRLAAVGTTGLPLAGRTRPALAAQALLLDVRRLRSVLGAVAAAELLLEERPPVAGLPGGLAGTSASAATGVLVAGGATVLLLAGAARGPLAAGRPRLGVLALPDLLLLAAPGAGPGTLVARLTGVRLARPTGGPGPRAVVFATAALLVGTCVASMLVGLGVAAVLAVPAAGSALLVFVAVLLPTTTPLLGRDALVGALVTAGVAARRRGPGRLADPSLAGLDRTVVASWRVLHVPAVVPGSPSPRLAALGRGAALVLEPLALLAAVALPLASSVVFVDGLAALVAALAAVVLVVCHRESDRQSPGAGVAAVLASGTRRSSDRSDGRFVRSPPPGDRGRNEGLTFLKRRHRSPLAVESGAGRAE